MDNQTAWDLLELYRKFNNIEDGCNDWNDLSLYGRYQFKKSPGGDLVWINAGYSTLFNLLMVCPIYFNTQNTTLLNSANVVYSRKILTVSRLILRVE